MVLGHKLRLDIKDYNSEETARNKQKRDKIVSAGGSCKSCSHAKQTSYAVKPLKCLLKNKTVNTYNFCENWEAK